MFQILFVLPLLVHCLAFSVDATGDISITLMEAQEKGLENSEVLLQKISNVKINEFELKKSRNLKYPKISFSGQYQRHFHITKTPLGPIAKNYKTENTALVEQAFWSFGKIDQAIDLNSKVYDISKIDRENFERTLRLEITKSYYGALLAIEVNKIRKESLLNAQKNRDILNRRFRNGRPPQPDILQLEREILSRKPRVEESLGNVDLAYQKLRTLLNVDRNEKIILESSFHSSVSIASWDNLLTGLIENSYQLKILKEQIAANEKSYQLSKKQILPTLGAFTSYTYAGEDDKAGFSSTSYSPAHIGAIGLNLTIPIWSQGQNRLDIKKAFENLKISEYQYRDSERNLRLKLNQLYIQFNSSLRGYKDSQDFYKISIETFKMSQRRFRNGQTSIVELNQTEELLTVAKLQMASKLHDMHRIKSEILELIGEKVIL